MAAVFRSDGQRIPWYFVVVLAFLVLANAAGYRTRANLQARLGLLRQIYPSRVELSQPLQPLDGFDETGKPVRIAYEQSATVLVSAILINVENILLMRMFSQRTELARARPGETVGPLSIKRVDAEGNEGENELLDFSGSPVRQVLFLLSPTCSCGKGLARSPLVLAYMERSDGCTRYGYCPLKMLQGNGEAKLLWLIEETRHEMGSSRY